jgi:hypothetical protein
MKNVSSKENKSTIGVMSMCGDRAGGFIFGIAVSRFNYLVAAAKDCTRLNPASSIL